MTNKIYVIRNSKKKQIIEEQDLDSMSLYNDLRTNNSEIGEEVHRVGDDFE